MRNMSGALPTLTLELDRYFSTTIHALFVDTIAVTYYCTVLRVIVLLHDHPENGLAGEEEHHEHADVPDGALHALLGVARGVPVAVQDEPDEADGATGGGVGGAVGEDAGEDEHHEEGRLRGE